MTLSILFSNPELVAIDKPSGISVHDAPGPGGSLLRLLKEQVGAEILHPVHRLDKDASGVLLFAKSKEATRALERIWSEKTDPDTIVKKTYWALCDGVPANSEGVIDAPILEHQTGKPERMERALNYFKRTNPDVEIPPLPAPKTSAVHPAGRASQTHFKVLKKSADGVCSWLELTPEQGRMHQIRVHLAHLGHPLLIDPLYGKISSLTLGGLFKQAPQDMTLNRMPLHAFRLEIPNPLYFSDRSIQPKRFTFEAPLPSDMASVVNFF